MDVGEPSASFVLELVAGLKTDLGLFVCSVYSGFPCHAQKKPTPERDLVSKCEPTPRGSTIMSPNVRRTRFRLKMRERPTRQRSKLRESLTSERDSISKCEITPCECAILFQSVGVTYMCIDRLQYRKPQPLKKLLKGYANG